jgi:type IV secretion system protein VirB10
VSRRAAGAVVVIGVVIMALFAYGGYTRQQREVEALAERGAPRSVAPAIAAGAEIARAVPTGSVPAVPAADGQLLPPDELKAPQQTAPSPHANGGSARAYSAAPPPVPNAEPTPEQRRVIAAYEAEQQAILAPTTFRSSVGQQPGSPAISPLPSLPTGRGGSDQPSEISSLIRSLAAATGRGSSETGFFPTNRYSNIEPHPEDKEEFLAKARAARGSDYLKSTRTAPLSPYEIKAGWEIPAVLEQALNSDLPGELKALVSSNVYDTATGRYLLIPQGSRLVGAYDSRVGYGQEGAQVVWDRVIYPDGSSLDLGGMIGQDAHGAAGFRDKVDRHYRRLVGFAVLTSMFAAASDLAQSHNRTLLTYPSAGEVAAGAVGREISDVGAQITRRNLNVQPTIKVPIGYRFNVRVNRDILFEAPYTPLDPGKR